MNEQLVDINLCDVNFVLEEIFQSACFHKLFKKIVKNIFAGRMTTRKKYLQYNKKYKPQMILLSEIYTSFTFDFFSNSSNLTNEIS